MKTDIYDSDPFTGRKGKLLVSIDTDYRFEKNDEFVIESGGSRIPMRVTFVQVRIRDGELLRDVVALRI